MNNTNETIGVGIITCNRPEYLRNLLTSLVPCHSFIDEIVVVNDGDPVIDFDLSKGEWIDNDTNLGVAKSKNKAMKHLFNKGCSYIFVIEDDMLIRNKSIFDQYIKLHKTSGIHHFNYGPGSPFNRKQQIANFDLHNRHLLNEETEPNPRLIIDYKHCKLSLFTHVTGTFSFYTKAILNKIGFIDEQFKNAWEHVDHTYQIIKAGGHPPFWWFADIFNSHLLIEPQKNSINNSTTSKNTKEWMNNVTYNAELYKIKNGHYPAQTPNVSEEIALSSLKSIKLNKSNLI